MERVKCAQCGYVNRQGRSACERCGASLPLVDLRVRTAAGRGADLSPPGGRGLTPPPGGDTGVEFFHGDVLAGRYRIEGVLGRGGMGCIYKAHDTTLDEVVALKTLLPEYVQDTVIVERFFNEARIARGLSHPNIVRVHDIGVADETVYISMEYVKGKSLREMLDELRPGQRIAMVTVLRVFDELCAALAYAHQYTIHRDIKPENVMIDTQGRTRLMDFGISKLMANPKLTATSMVMGTPHYMSPEQLRDSAKVDARSDVYSLGIMLYEVLVGATPTGIVRPASEISQKIPPALDGIIEKCLEPDPDKRYQNTAELRAALGEVRGALDSEDAAGTGPRRRNGAPPSVRARKAVAGVLLALIAASALLGLWKAEERRRQQTPDAKVLSEETLSAAVAAPGAEIPARVFEALEGWVETAKKRAGAEHNWSPAAAGHRERVEEILAEAEARWTQALEGRDRDVERAVEGGWKALHCYLAPLVWPEGMVFVPAGKVSLGAAQGGGGTVDVAAFFVDEREVTYGAFTRFCERSGWRRPPHYAYKAYANPSFPMTNVTFYDAQAFAASASPAKRIPTEAQWARAAYGEEGRFRAYPWGEEWKEGAAHTGQSPAPAEVGGFEEDAGGYGGYDWLGNVMEWTRSKWNPSPYGPAQGREDESSLRFRTGLVVRGGCFNDLQREYRLGTRTRLQYEEESPYVGFRCVFELPTTAEDVASSLNAG